MALKTTSGSDAVEVRKSVRKFGPDGAVICETSNMPLDYFIRPTDEIRVRKGVVYELASTESELQINTWDTN